MIRVLVTVILIWALSTPVIAQESAPSRSIGTQELRHALSDVAEKALPSVVTVLSTKTLTMGRGRRGFRDFFSQSRGRREFKQHGLGSGVIVSQSGLILTNNHVIAEADQLRVRLHSGEELNAQVIGTDPRSDIAVIKVDRTDLTPAPIGNSDKLRIAEVVLCVGSPLSEELGHTVTQGIVSAKGRNSVGVTDYEDFIQTDAAINPGNSGGAHAQSGWRSCRHQYRNRVSYRGIPGGGFCSALQHGQICDGPTRLSRESEAGLAWGGHSGSDA